MAVLSREQFDEAMRNILGSNYGAVQQGLEQGVGAVVGVGARPRAATPTPSGPTANWGERAAPPEDTPVWGDPPSPPDEPGRASAGWGSASDLRNRAGRPLGSAIDDQYWKGVNYLGEGWDKLGNSFEGLRAPDLSSMQAANNQGWGARPSAQPANSAELWTPPNSVPVTPEMAEAKLAATQGWTNTAEGQAELANAQNWVADSRPEPESLSTPSTPFSTSDPTGLAGPALQPAGTNAIPPVSDGWASEFARVHGRAPTLYDARVRQEMEGWQTQNGGRPPTGSDWVAVTKSLNNKGIYGPREVPEYAPGYGPNANPALRAPITQGTGSLPISKATGPAAATPIKAQAPQATSQGTSLGLNQQGYQKYAGDITDSAQRYGVDPELVTALIQGESGFDPKATSKAGAGGLMQIMPDTAKGLGLTPDSYFHERSNIDAGTKYLASQVRYYKDAGYPEEQVLPLALSAYNAGGARVNAFIRGEQPLPAETVQWVPRVMALYNQLKTSRNAAQ